MYLVYLTRGLNTKKKAIEEEWIYLSLAGFCFCFLFDFSGLVLGI